MEGETLVFQSSRGLSIESVSELETRNKKGREYGVLAPVKSIVNDATLVGIDASSFFLDDRSRHVVTRHLYAETMVTGFATFDGDAKNGFALRR